MKFDHPNIVKLISYYIKDNTLSLVLEYIMGGSLWDHIMKKSLSDLEIFKIFEQIVDALIYMHEKKIIHRDIKPENILIDNE